MVNKYWGEFSSHPQPDGDEGAQAPKAAGKAKMKYRTGEFPGLPGKTGPERNKWKVAKKVNKYAKSEGL